MNLKLLNVIGIQDLIERIGKTIETFVTNKTERERLMAELVKIIYQLDMSSDSWLSKNIRPLTLLLGWVVFISFAFLDGQVVEIKEVYVDMLSKMLWTLTGFYFGLRELGKQLLKNKK